MIELNDDKVNVPVKKATFNKKNDLKKQSKRIKEKFAELDGQYEGTSKKKKRKMKTEYGEGEFTPPVKTKEKGYDVHEYVQGILEKYEVELSQDLGQFESSYGKIIDWGEVNTDEIVEKLLVTLEQLCNIKLFPYQKIFAARVFQSVLLNDGEEITALWSRQSGKSECVTDVVATLMAILPILSQYFPQLSQFDRGVFVGVFAPTEPQAKTISERFRLRIGSQEAANFLSDPEVDIAVDSLWMSNGSYVRIHSAAPQAKVESKTYHIIIIDEAQDVSDEKVLKCYAENTPINMPNGTTLTIKDVVTKKLNVLTPSGEVTPSDWSPTGILGCYRLKLDNGREISITDEHKHLVFRKGWKKTRQMTTREIIDFEGKPGYDLRIAVPDCLPYFGDYGNYDRGLILGYFLGDGCLQNSPQFCGMYDDWERLNRAVFNEFNCTVKVYPANIKNGLIEGHYRARNTWKNPLTEWFREIGSWKCKGELKHIPNLPYSEDFVKGLISGLIETDGCIENFNKKPIISFANISENLVRGLQDQLLKFGIHARVFSRKQNGDFGANPNDLWVLHIKDAVSIRRFYSQIQLHTKQGKLEQAYLTIKNNDTRNSCKYYSSQYRFCRIVDISEEGIKPTYCVTVPTDEHLIIANGIVSGNSIHPMGAACITGDSVIPLEDGRVVNLRDYKIENATGCFSEEFKFSTQHPLEFIDSGVQDCLNIRLSSGKNITGTIDHPVVVKPREYPRLPVWKELKEVRVGDQVAVPKSVPYFGNVSVGKDEARILGILVGDGTYGKKVSPTLSNEDSEVLDFWCNWIIKNGAVPVVRATHVTKKGRIYQEVACCSANKGLTLIGKNPAINLLRSNGIYGQTKDAKRIPKGIWTAPKEDVAEFIGGLFDTDGCITLQEGRRAVIDISQANKPVLEELSYLLIKFGIHCTIRSIVSSGKGFAPKGNVYYRLDIKDRDSILAFASNIKFLIQRKQEELLKAVEILSLRRSKKNVSIIKGTGKFRKASILDYDIVFERVIEVSNKGKQQVYDIAMPEGYHNFIANNIVVHNTSATIIKLGTPHMRQCEFLEAITRNKRIFQLSKNKVKNHFEFDYTVVSKYNERYARWIQKEKSRYGEDSDYFRMSYKLEWLLQKGMAITSDDFERKMKATSMKLESTPDNRFMYVAGLDLGKKYDSTVLTIVKLVRRDTSPRRYIELMGDEESEEASTVFVDADMYYKQVSAWFEWEGDNWESQVDDIVRVCKRYDTLQVLSIDSTGVGDPIHEMVSRRLAYRDVHVQPVYFSLQNQHKLAQLFYKNLNHENIRIPSHASAKKTRKYNKFMVQLLDAEKVWKNDKMIIRHGTYKGAKDDYVQSFFLALNAAEEAVNMGSAIESPNYFSLNADPNDDSINYVEDIIDRMDISEIRGFDNVRRAAREGKLVVNKATFHRTE